MNNQAGRHLREWIVLSVALLAFLVLAQRAHRPWIVARFETIESLH